MPSGWASPRASSSIGCSQIQTHSCGILRPATGIYAPAPIEKRRELANEQYRFAAAVLAYDPVGQITASLNDAFQQLRMVGLSDFLSAAEQAFPTTCRAFTPSGWRDPRYGEKIFPLRSFLH